MDRLTIDLEEDDEIRCKKYKTYYKNIRVLIYDTKYRSLERDYIEVYLRNINIDLLFEVDYLLKNMYSYLFEVEKTVELYHTHDFRYYGEFKLYNPNSKKKHNHYYPEPQIKNLMQDIINILEEKDKNKI